MRTLSFFVCFLLFQIIIAKNVYESSELEDLDKDIEVPVTDTEPTSETTEALQKPCPPDKSLHTKEDIKSMIDYSVKTLSIYNSIKKGFYSEATIIRDKHVNDINQFRSWYQNRPEHLKHNIEDLAFLRVHIEPLVRRVANALENYPELKDKYDDHLDKTKTLLNKRDRYKIICENNCEVDDSFRLTRRSDFNGYYCSSIEELDQKIKSTLTKFTKQLTSSMLNQIKSDDNEFSKKIDEFKNKLKNIALKEFGRTMYDVLNLQDEYHHFIKDLKQIDSNSMIYKIKAINFRIDRKLLRLEKRIENYGIYCRTCNENMLQYISEKTYRHFTDNHEENVSKDLVDHLLNLKYKELQNLTMNDYYDLFKELNSSLNNTDSEDIYLNDLKPMQDEIIAMLETEETEFKELKEFVDPTSVAKLIELSSDSKQLLSNINEEIYNLE